MKSTSGILTIVTTIAHAGTTTAASPGNSASPTADAFASARRPISNPTLFDLAIPRSNVHAIMMYQQMPDRAAIAGGGSVPLGGDFQVYALQVE
jgi:hypothetical protein